MAPISMTLSDLKARFQGHNIIQRQITRKRYKIELQLQWRTHRKSYMSIKVRHFQRPQTQISRLDHSLSLNISEMAKDTAIVTTEGE